MTLLACIPVTGSVTLAEVATASLSAADNTYQLDDNINVVFEDNGGADILTVYEANLGVQAHAHAAIGAQAAINGGSLDFGFSQVVLDIEETFTDIVDYHVGLAVYIYTETTEEYPFVEGLDVFLTDENGTAVGFGPRALQFEVDTYNDEAYGYGFIGNCIVRAGAADTMYGGYMGVNISTGATLDFAWGLFIDNSSFGGVVDRSVGLEIGFIEATNPFALITAFGHIIFNEIGHDDTDFRVEGATDTHLLFTDGSADRIGINDSTPDGKLDIVQSDANGAIPVVELEQLDLSEEFFNFVGTVATGNPIEAVGAKTLTTTHFIRIAVNGSFLYIPVGTIA